MHVKELAKAKRAQEEAENLVANYEEQLEKIQEDIQNDADKEIAEAKRAQDEETESLVADYKKFYEEELEEIRKEIQDDADKEIAEAKQARDKAEDLVAIYAERLEDICEDADRRIDPSELNECITCEKCAKYSWYPFMLCTLRIRGFYALIAAPVHPADFQ
ncbi:hypothetical protein ARMSODRAFT_1022348 [Armillaria solidipes]|uniref:Uncharacterized protein n=1 Tax=Armillaria solidipes TaxID=1076256 RepID=A0A2H3BNV9_9AGAR|nr:hypothetical protein ARMSODRAFT_1022348 [Armillaria solidipes]